MSLKEPQRQKCALYDGGAVLQNREGSLFANIAMVNNAWISSAIPMKAAFTMGGSDAGRREVAKRDLLIS
jgi:hypothetical protein